MALISPKLFRAIEEVVRDYENIVEDAVNYAVGIAAEDIYTKAMSCLNEYYDNYEPTSYNRTDNLWHAIVPYMQVNKKEGHIQCEVGVKYDSSMLNMYSGSKKYNPTDGEWILNHYLAGVHPGTDGSSVPRENPYSPQEWIEVVRQYGQIDKVSPSEKMHTFLTRYGKEFDNNVGMYFMSEIGKKI